MLSNPKWSPPSKTDFLLWLESKDPDETYNFQDSCGNCLMGQYMASKGQAWDFCAYADYGREFIDGLFHQVLSTTPWTVGALLERTRRNQLPEKENAIEAIGMTSMYDCCC